MCYWRILKRTKLLTDEEGRWGGLVLGRMAMSNLGQTGKSCLLTFNRIYDYAAILV